MSTVATPLERNNQAAFGAFRERQPFAVPRGVGRMNAPITAQGYKSMREYIIKRVFLMIPSLFGVALVVFILIRLAPGDVIGAMMAEGGRFSEGDVLKLRQQLGLDRPLYEQFYMWIWGVMRLDLGTSLWTGQPVLTRILERFPITLELAALAVAVSSSMGVLVGVVSAIRQDTPLDYVLRFITMAALSIPSFWLGTITIVFPAIWWGYMPPITYIPLTQDPVENLRLMAVPAVILGAASSATLARMARSQLLEVLRQDYIRTAWSKGLRERTIIVRHALKNALIPVVTVLGSQVSHLMGGTVIMETIFSLPGLGRLLIESINARDVLQVQGSVLFMATIFLVVNLLVDMTYSLLDPRIRYR
ncbi:MAG: ABC transporter permease [Chloroflexi bacterium]|nr:ABC transporter permease [Chloroflexota bacterium]